MVVISKVKAFRYNTVVAVVTDEIMVVLVMMEF